jgi:hypothetical protein
MTTHDTPGAALAAVLERFDGDEFASWEQEAGDILAVLPPGWCGHEAEMLRPWLRHKAWCNVKTDDPPDTKRCKCGLRAALAPSEP